MWPREHETQNVAMRVHSGLEGRAMRGCPGSGATGTQLAHLPASPRDTASFVSMIKSERGSMKRYVQTLFVVTAFMKVKKSKAGKCLLTDLWIYIGLYSIEHHLALKKKSCHSCKLGGLGAYVNEIS